MAKQKRAFSSFIKMCLGICVEVFATLLMMAVVFVAGVLILRLFAK